MKKRKDLDVIGEASNAADALKEAVLLEPDLVLVDISLDGSNGIDLVRILRGRLPEVRILMLSMHKEELHAERALRAGANGYIMKRESGRQLIETIRLV